MTTSTNSTPSNTGLTEKKIPQPTAKVEDTKTDVDDLGYDVIEDDEPKDEIPSDDEPKDDEPKKDDVKVEPSTGYGQKDEEEPKKDETKKDDEKPAEETEEQKAEKELKEVVQALGDGYDKDKIAKFAKDNKLTKDQLKAYVDMAREEDANSQKAQADAVKAQRKSWEKELRDDVDFGGKGNEETFLANVAKVDRVLEKFPNLKKNLTDKKGMLPPYLMRDLLGVHKMLNPTTKFETGEPSVPAVEEKHYLDEMYE